MVVVGENRSRIKDQKAEKSETIDDIFSVNLDGRGGGEGARLLSEKKEAKKIEREKYHNGIMGSFDVPAVVSFLFILIN